MRSAVPSRSPVSAGLGLALLVPALWTVARPAPARAGDPPPPAAVRGTVVRASDGLPIPYVSVVDTTSRVGAVTDEQGRFLLAGLTAGRVAIRVQAIGSPPLFETFEVAPGDTARRVYRLATPAHGRFLQVRDSLAARGLWPPALEPALYAHMRDALDVRVYRLDPERPVHDGPPDPARRIGAWPIVAEAPAPDRALVRSLIDALRDPELYLPDIEGVGKLCDFAPELAVRFNNLGVSTDVLVCFACGEFAILRDGRPRQTGDVEGRGPDFVRFAKRVFPDDPVIRKLGAKGRRAAR